jgi:hypothetical protein
MSGVHVRYFFFTLTVAAALGDLTLDPATAAAFARRAGSPSALMLDRARQARRTSRAA